MRAASSLLVVVAGGALVTGCNPLAFNDVADSAWVESTDKPDDVNSEGYASAVAFAGSSGSGAGILVVATAPPAVVLLDYAAAGGVEKVSKDVRDGFDSALNLADRPAIAVVPDGFGGSDANAFLGVSSGGVHYALPILTETVNFSTPIQLVGADDPALSLAAGDFIGEEEFDLAALTPGGVFLVTDRGFPDAPDPVSCVLENRATIAVMGDRLAVGGDGEVVLVNPAAIVDETDCAVEASSEGGGEADLGDAMAVGDFDGNGELDLAVGASTSDTVYVLMNGDFADPVEIDAPDGSNSFGFALAAGDLDHDGDDELAIGEPQFDGESLEGGQVLVFDHDGNSFELLTTLADVSPESDQHFGQSVAVVDFDGDHDKGILVVGAEDEVFTYFQLTADGDDVRR